MRISDKTYILQWHKSFTSVVRLFDDGIALHMIASLCILTTEIDVGTAEIFFVLKRNKPRQWRRLVIYERDSMLIFIFFSLPFVYVWVGCGLASPIQRTHSTLTMCIMFECFERFQLLVDSMIFFCIVDVIRQPSINWTLQLSVRCRNGEWIIFLLCKKMCGPTPTCCLLSIVAKITSWWHYLIQQPYNRLSECCHITTGAFFLLVFIKFKKFDIQSDITEFHAHKSRTQRDNSKKEKKNKKIVKENPRQSFAKNYKYTIS